MHYLELVILNRGGGGGTIKIINACKEHKIDPPVFSNYPPDFQVELFRYSDEGLKKDGCQKGTYANSSSCTSY